MPSPSMEHAWRRTKTLLHEEAKKKIQDLLKKKKQVSMCDIGCGNGAFLIRLAQELRNPRVVCLGIDLSNPFVNYAQAAAKAKDIIGVSFKQVDFEKENIDQKFDIVISSEVLEHVGKPDIFLKKIHALLFEGGYFFLSTPNGNNLIKYLLFPLKRYISKKHEEDIKKFLTPQEEKFKLSEQEQHLFVFSHKFLIQMLKNAGFEIYKIPRSTTFFGGKILDENPLLFAGSLLFDSFCNLFPFPQIGWDIIMFCRKK